ncbi:MAG: hypothetical protein NZO41_03430 [Candidatus Bipolaricaulota bacterium]|nr:hypothetical protein [Candidatus Bipolaricaulota bacterium]
MTRQRSAAITASALLVFVILWLATLTAFSQPKVISEPVLKESGKRGGKVDRGGAEEAGREGEFQSYPLCGV